MRNMHVAAPFNQHAMCMANEQKREKQAADPARIMSEQVACGAPSDYANVEIGRCNRLKSPVRHSLAAGRHAGAGAPPNSGATTGSSKAGAKWTRPLHTLPVGTARDTLLLSRISCAAARSRSQSRASRERWVRHPQNQMR